MGPIAINLTHSGVHLKYLMMTRYLHNEAWMASFSLWYSFNYIILIYMVFSKHCFIFHEYTFLNHFHLLVSFKNIYINSMLALFPFFSNNQFFSLYGLRTCHLFGLGEDGFDLKN